MSLTQSQESAAQQAIDSLNHEYMQALANVASTTPVWGSGNVKDAVLSNLHYDRDRIDRLSGELLDQVRSDELAWERWVSIAEVTRQDIAYQGGLTSEWSLSGVLRSAVSATGEQIGDKIITGPPTWMLVVGGGVLVVAGLYYLSPLINLAGSRKRLAGRNRR